LAIRPESEADLAEAVRAATGALHLRGGGTRAAGPVVGEVLETTGLTGITLYEPGALTLVARAGTPLSEIEEALTAENQRLAFEPMDHRALLGTEGTPTIGGAVAVNASGPRRVVAGACRDSLIGVRFVDGSGTIIKNGGRVMKNVTGYDLVKLLAGSHGTLGVLSEVSFKVLPGVEATTTLTLNGLDVDTAIKAMAAAMGSPFEVSAAAHLPGETPKTHLRVEGFEASVAYRAGRLRDLLAPYGDIVMDEGPGPWADIRDARALADAPGDVWRVSVKPSDGARVAAALPDARLVMDWAGGLVWAAVKPGTDLRAALKDIPGHATLLRAAPETHARLGRFAPEPAPLAAIADGLRAKFDPRGILNPGLMTQSTS